MSIFALFLLILRFLQTLQQQKYGNKHKAQLNKNMVIFTTKKCTF